jgi:hypothetical protein
MYQLLLYLALQVLQFLVLQIPWLPWLLLDQ